MNIDAPPPNTSLSSPFTITGWAYDARVGAGNGPGVDYVFVFLGTTCSGTVVGQGTPFIPRQDVRAFFNLDNSYINSGFSITVNLPNGAQTVTACARRSGTGFNIVAQSSRTFNVTTTARLNIDSPASNAAVPQLLQIEGWAFDSSVGVNNGPGLSEIVIFQGTACYGTNIGQSAINRPRADVRSAFGLDASYANTGWLVNVGLPSGTSAFTVCGRQGSGPFLAQSTRTVNVSSTGMVVMDAPAPNSTVPRTFTVSGWTVNTAGGRNGGPGAFRVDLFAGNACSGTSIASAFMTIARPDVRTFFNLDASYTDIGYSTSVTRPAGGAFTFTACAFGYTNGGGGYVGQTTLTVTLNP